MTVLMGSYMKVIVFVCNGNTARSQMAEAFFNAYNKDPGYYAASAGISPGKSLKKEAIDVMKERGIDISSQKPKALTEKLSRDAERIITMGCVDSCPLTPEGKTTDWGLEDVSGKPIGKYREVRERIEAKVKGLLSELGGRAVSAQT